MNKKHFEIEFLTKEEFDRFNQDVKVKEELNVLNFNHLKKQAEIQIQDSDINHFINFISAYDLKFFSEIKFTLEDYFMKFYDNNSDAGEGAG